MKCRKRKFSACETDLTIQVPPEILHFIFSFLDNTSLGHLEQVCKRFQIVVQRVWNTKAKEFVLVWEVETPTITSKQIVHTLSKAEYAWKHNQWRHFQPEFILREYLDALYEAATIGSKKASRKFVSYFMASTFLEDKELKQNAQALAKPNLEEVKRKYKEAIGTSRCDEFLYKYIQTRKRYCRMNEIPIDEWILKKLAPLIESNYPKAFRLRSRILESFPDLVKAAELGDRVEQNKLGAYYATGNNFISNTQDFQEAFKWYLKAASQGFAESQYNIAYMYSEGELGEVDHKQVFRWAILAAEQGHPYAQHKVAACYKYGEGVRKNMRLYRYWMLQSANGGCKLGMRFTGIRYYEGTCGFPKDYEKAACWFARADPDPPSMANLGMMYRYGLGVEKDFSKGIELLQKASDLGDASAKFHLGEMYELGTGVKRNIRKAISLYRQAAQDEDCNALFALGECYLNGVGTKKSVNKALEYIQKAANLGDSHAQYCLAREFYMENSLKEDSELCRYWYRQAAINGNVSAQFALGRVYYEGRGVRRNDQVAFSWWLKAAQNGHKNACFNLGVLYEKGQGVMKDLKKSQMWLSKAKIEEIK